MHAKEKASEASVKHAEGGGGGDGGGVMTLKLPFTQWEFSISGETGNSLFSTDVYSPSIFPCPHQSSVLHWRPVLSQLYPCIQQSNENTRK